jgi:DNA-binding IscR family transcriptional regulator
LHFAYHILKKLESGGLVEISRGSSGGIRLCADLKRVTLHGLLSVIEETRAISACVQPGFECAWRKKNGGTCTIHKQLLGIQNLLDEEFRKRSLYEMMFGGQ